MANKFFGRSKKIQWIRKKTQTLSQLEMAVVRVGGFGPSGITNTISYCHTSREGGVWRLLSEVIFHFVSTLYCEMCPQAYCWLRNKCPGATH